MGQTHATSSSGGSLARAEAPKKAEAPRTPAVSARSTSRRSAMRAGGITLVNVFRRYLIGVGASVLRYVQPGSVVGPVDQPILEYRIGSGNALGNRQCVP